MPTYDYLCASCGPFSAFRPMAEFRDPQPCLACGEAAPRATLTAPQMSVMNAARRTAIATNERSANAPARSAGRHPAACGCCKPARGKLSAEAVPAAKSSPAARPWMISH